MSEETTNPTPQAQDKEIVIFELQQRQASVFHSSKYFKTDQVSQAIVKVMAGAELGIPPFAAMNGIHIINGKPGLSAMLMGSLVKSSAKYNYKVGKNDKTEAVVHWFEDGESVGSSSFTWEEAIQAGLTGKDVWKKYPSDMVFARALTRGVRRFCPDLLAGSPAYTPEELEDNVIEGEYSLASESVTDPESPEKRPPPTEIVEDAQTDGPSAKEAALERSRAKLSEATDIPEEVQEELQAWVNEEDPEPTIRTHHHVATEAEAEAQAALFPEKATPPGHGAYGEQAQPEPIVPGQAEITRWRSKCRQGRQTVGHVANYAHMALDTINAQKHGVHVLEKHFEVPAEALEKGFTWKASQRVTQDTAEAMFDLLATYVPQLEVKE